MIRIGTAGWSYADWQGRVYPERKPRNFHPLAYLARYIDCIEINSTFYAQPRAKYSEHWVRLVEPHPNFRFTAKLLGTFTHDAWPRADVARAAADRFRAGLAPLEESGRLAGLLAQFPHSFRRDPATRRRLERIHELFDGSSLVLELRHASWFSVDARRELSALGSSLAHIDLPTGPDQAPRDFEQTAAPGYLRMHGRNRESWFDASAGRDQRYDYLYAAQEVGEIVERVRRLAAGKDETYVIANNHFAGQALVNALELRAALREEQPLGPAPLVEAYPRLRGTVRVDGQASFF